MALQDMERGMYIYHARKDDKRTFVDIGKELGISPNRVRAIYHRLDWNLNRFDADQFKKKPIVMTPYVRQLMDEYKKQ